MIGNILRNDAENIFVKNINKNVKVELISEDNIIIEGKLIMISCNTLIVETKDEEIKMFRYEDIRYLV